MTNTLINSLMAAINSVECCLHHFGKSSKEYQTAVDELQRLVKISMRR